MSRIRAKDTKPEMMLRKVLFAAGFRFRLHDRRLPGKPDIVLKRYRTVIFVHGCFWHGHENCKYFVVPKTRTEWWMQKIAQNKRNDQKAKSALELAGWQVWEVFECGLRKERFQETVTALINHLKSNQDVDQNKISG